MKPSTAPRPLGVFGGTFDPVHYGHLRLAEEAADALQLERIRWIPAGLPALRDAPRVGPAQRLDMVRLAISGNPRFELDPAEVEAEQTSFTVRRVNYVLQHPEHYFMLANLDRVVRTPEGESGILEIKTAGFYSTEQWEESIPIAYQCQVLHQLAVTGHAWAEVAVLIGGQDFRIYRIERDEEKIQDLTEREAQFWQMVQQDQQPEPDGSSDAANALSWLFPRDDGQTVDLSDSPEFNQLFGELLRLRQQKEAVEQQESQLKQRLQATLGEATAGLFADGKITWKRSKDRLAPDLDKLGQDHPDLLTRYVKPVPGVRRFTIQPLRQTP